MKHMTEPDIEINKLGAILEPTKNEFETKAVLNPGCHRDGDSVHILYRAINKDDVSTIGYALLKPDTEIVERHDEPLIGIDYDYESKGVEDPRITVIDGTYYVTYVAHDGKNAVAAYAKGPDLFHLEKQGIITPKLTYDDAADAFREEPLKDNYFMYEAFYEEFAGKDVLLWEKDVFFFPRKINGKYAMVHRILPDVHLAFFEDFRELETQRFWEKYLSELADHVMLENKYWFETRSIGGGAPPIETPDGWLMIYHSVEDANKGRTYHASAALMDLEDPTKVIGRLPYPLFSPDQDFEKKGYVNNVVFPTGVAVFGDDIHIYYGMADKRIGLAKTSLKDLVTELKKYPSDK